MALVCLMAGRIDVMSDPQGPQGIIPCGSRQVRSDSRHPTRASLQLVGECGPKEEGEDHQDGETLERLIPQENLQIWD